MDMRALRGYNGHVQDTVRVALREGGTLEGGADHVKLRLPNGDLFPIHAFRRGYGSGMKDLRTRVFKSMEAQGLDASLKPTKTKAPATDDPGMVPEPIIDAPEAEPERVMTGEVADDPHGRLRCPECQELFKPGGLGAHRRKKHGVIGRQRAKWEAQAGMSTNGRPGASAVITTYTEPTDKRISAKRLLDRIAASSQEQVETAARLVELFNTQHEELADVKARLKKIESALGKAVENL